jgi:hypothetical protein
MSLPPRTERPLHWVGSAKRDLLSFPEGVVDEFGYHPDRKASAFRPGI